MDKIAFVFSGQGDQFVGMGKDLYDNYSSATEVFNELEKIRPNTLKLMFDGNEEDLKQTRNTQPCLFAFEMAGAKVLKENGIEPSIVAGFSLGEVVALTYAGIVSLEDGFNMVCRRGEIMQTEAEKYNTSMVAVVKLDNEKVKELASHYSQVYPVNFNCPGQVSVAGDSEQILEFSQEVKETGGRAIPLKVSGGFHSPYMQNATNEFREVIESVNFNKEQIKLYSNLTGKPYSENMKEILANQISNPVLWEKIIRNMIAEGINVFIEIGPGKTLSNMISKIDNNVKVYSLSNINEILAEVK